MFVSNPFTADPRVYSEARSLVKAGFQVTVVARDWGKENLPRDEWDGIEIRRVASSVSPSRIPGGSLLKGLILALWQWRAYREALALNRENAFSILHCHDLDTLLIGVALKRRLALPLIYDAHEIYGHMMTRHFPGFVAHGFLWLEKRLLRRVDVVISVHEVHKQYFERITDKPIHVVMNCKPLRALEYQPPDNAGAFTILYIGVLHRGREVFMLVDAARELTGVRCIIGGIGLPEFVEALEQECQAAPNVDFIGRVPMDETVLMTGKSDVVFVMVNPKDLNNRAGLGNKQFEAMVCGRPTICTRGTYSGEVTEVEQVGLTVECDKEALKQAIVRLRDDPELREKLGRNALRAAITKYNWGQQEESLLEVYRRAAPDPDRG